MENIQRILKQLKLSGMAQTLTERNQYALDQQVSYLAFLELLLEDEQVVRKSNAYKRRYKASGLNHMKRLELYEFSAQPKLDKKRILDLAACRFISQKQNLIFMGKPGTGKTHLAHAIGLKAIEKGFSVIFAHTHHLLDELQRARADSSWLKRMKQIEKLDLLILDEIGFKQLPQAALEDFFEIIRYRYEHAATIITTNRSFEDWAKIIGDPVMASAIIDRLIHHAHVIKLSGDSFRMKAFAKNHPQK